MKKPVEVTLTNPLQGKLWNVEFCFIPIVFHIKKFDISLKLGIKFLEICQVTTNMSIDQY